MMPTYSERQALARQFVDDVNRMRRCLLAAGRQAEIDEIVFAWADYSGALRAGWLMLPDDDASLLAILLKHLPSAAGRWIVTAADAGNGSGDMIVPLPDELMAQLGWQKGELLSISRDDSGGLVLHKVG